MFLVSLLKYFNEKMQVKIIVNGVVCDDTDVKGVLNNGLLSQFVIEKNQLTVKNDTIIVEVIA